MATSVLPTTPANVGKWLLSKLTGSSAVAALVGTRVFPFRTPDEQPLPWIVWDDMVISYEYSKDDVEESRCELTLHAAAATYAASCALLSAIDSAINCVDGCRISSVAALYDIEMDAYMNDINIVIDF